VKCPKCNSISKLIDHAVNNDSNEEAILYECVKCSHIFMMSSNDTDESEISFNMNSLIHIVFFFISANALTIGIKSANTSTTIYGFIGCFFSIVFFFVSIFENRDVEELKPTVEHSDKRNFKKSNLSRKARKSQKK